MDITIDLTFFYHLLEVPPYEAVWLLITHGGWAVILLIIFGVIWFMWVARNQNKYLASIKYVLLAIDVPKDNIQGPQTAEYIFSTLAAAYSSSDFIERNFGGYLPIPFSFEIVSLGGYIQFLVYTQEKFRDLVEAAVYAQYPDAEISEVEDYAESGPTNFPNDEYELWGTELILYNNDAYPIRTYPAFEDKMAKDDKFKDPMASLLEMLGKIGEGEQIWLQLVITPCGQDWKDKGDKEVKKLIGKKEKSKKSIFDQVLDSSNKIVSEIGASVFGGVGGGEEKKKDEPPSLVTFLSPGAKDVVAAIESKISKIGFFTKYRFIYLAKKEFANKGRAISGVMGSLQQFNTLNLNGFKPDSKTKTSIDYFFIERRVAGRQQRIMSAYKKRSNLTGAKPYILNIEELASLFHFPVSEVRTPLLKKTEAKRGRAPISLPTQGNPAGLIEESSKIGEAPANLPIVEE